MECDLVMTLSVSLDTNLFYDKAENREGVEAFDTIVNLARHGKVQLWWTPTTDLEDQSGVAIRIALRLMAEGVLGEAPGIGTPREYIPGAPYPHAEDTTACEELLQAIWPGERWRSATDNKQNDVRHLLAHRINGFDIIATGDVKILQKRRLLRDKFNIVVMTTNELLLQIR